MPLRKTIRKEIANVILLFIYETEQFNGIVEILEVLNSIITGFSIPLKNEHSIFFKRVLLPLHKSSLLEIFEVQLPDCVEQFLKKDSRLAPVVVMELLKYWPKTCSRKEVFFLNELSDILITMDDADFVKIAEPVSKIIADSMCSQHFLVSTNDKD